MLIGFMNRVFSSVATLVITSAVLFFLAVAVAIFVGLELYDRFETGAPESVALAGSIVPMIAAAMVVLVSAAVFAKARNRKGTGTPFPTALLITGIVFLAVHLVHLYGVREAALVRNRAIRISIALVDQEATTEMTARLRRVGYNVVAVPTDADIVLEPCNTSDVGHDRTIQFRFVQPTRSLIIANYLDERLIDDIALSRDTSGAFSVGNGPVSEMPIQQNRFFAGAHVRPKRVPSKLVYVSCGLESYEIRKCLSGRLIDLKVDETADVGSADFVLECTGEVDRDGLFLGNAGQSQGYRIASQLSLKRAGNSDDTIMMVELPVIETDAVVQGVSTWDNVVEKWTKHVVSKKLIDNLLRSMK